MLICRAQLHDTSNVLTLRMSSKQIRFQDTPELIGVNSWIPQTIRQWIPECWSSDGKFTGPKGATANSRNWQLTTVVMCVFCTFFLKRASLSLVFVLLRLLSVFSTDRLPSFYWMTFESHLVTCR